MTGTTEDRYVELLTGSQNRLWGYIHSLTGDAEQAQDILQETSRKLWQLRDQYDPARPFIPWAFKVAYNQVRTARQKMRREQLVFHNEETLRAIADEYGNWQERIDQRSKALDRCLGKLDKRQRKLIRDYYGGGSTIKAVAEKLGRQAKSLAVTLHRIRQILTDCVRRELL